jgi:hypothetical protein
MTYDPNAPTTAMCADCEKITVSPKFSGPWCQRCTSDASETGSEPRARTPSSALDDQGDVRPRLAGPCDASCLGCTSLRFHPTRWKPEP